MLYICVIYICTHLFQYSQTAQTITPCLWLLAGPYQRWHWSSYCWYFWREDVTVSGSPWRLQSLETWHCLHFWSYGRFGGTCCLPLYCSPATSINLAIYTGDVNVCKYCCEVFVVVGSGLARWKCACCSWVMEIVSGEEHVRSKCKQRVLMCFSPIFHSTRTKWVMRSMFISCRIF
jgi:hypothetical protein